MEAIFLRPGNVCNVCHKAWVLTSIQFLFIAQNSALLGKTYLLCEGLIIKPSTILTALVPFVLFWVGWKYLLGFFLGAAFTELAACIKCSRLWCPLHHYVMLRSSCSSVGQMDLGQVRGSRLFLTRYHPGHRKKGAASFWIGIVVFGINNASIIVCLFMYCCCNWVATNWNSWMLDDDVKLCSLPYFCSAWELEKSSAVLETMQPWLKTKLINRGTSSYLYNAF